MAILKEEIAVLPLGATEQHGPHLPFETDSLIVEGIVSAMKPNLPTSFKVRFLPTETIGYSPEHLDFHGTRSLSAQACIERWTTIGADLAEQGTRKLLLLNAHGGNSPLMTIVSTELRVRHAMLCVATSWTRFDRRGIDIANPEIDIHGGEIETSVMLALHPEKVDMNRAENFPSRQSEWLASNDLLSAYGKHAFGWKIQDLNSRGVCGDASRASSEKGRQLIENATSGIIRLLEEMHTFDIGIFDR